MASTNATGSMAAPNLPPVDQKAANFVSVEGFVYRFERFQTRVYECTTLGNAFGLKFAPVVAPGIIPDTNGQVSLVQCPSADGSVVRPWELRFRLYHANAGTTEKEKGDFNDWGFMYDDIIATLRNMLASAPQDDYFDAATKMLNMALLALDTRSRQRHGFADSPLELAVPPESHPQHFEVPTREEWDAMYDAYVPKSMQS
jgi:hypothetical protein